MTADPLFALKRQLADEILALASQANMHVAARVFGIGVPRMSDLRHGRIARFSVERLIRILAEVDRKVELSVVAPGRRLVPWFAILFARRRSGARTRRPNDIRNATLGGSRRGRPRRVRTESRVAVSK